MKFRLNIPKITLARHRSQASRQQRHLSIDAAVETWNELRVVGSEAAHRKHLGIKDDNDLVVQEAHDWDAYIAQFNEQYRQQLREEREQEDRDSVSTIAETKSELMKSRKRRLIVYRKGFIFTCLLSWGVFCSHVWYWFYIYYVWPLGFARMLTVHKNWIAKFFAYEPSAVFTIFLHSWLVGCWGLLCAFCFKERPNVLRFFILRGPCILIFPVLLVWETVSFTGSISSTKLTAIMDSAISFYHDVNSPYHNESRITWDRIQRAEQCCGVQNGPEDWHSVDLDLTDNKTFIPVSCCPKEFMRRKWKGERRKRDDCYHKIDKTKYVWSYPDGCRNKALTVYVKIGAYGVGIMVVDFLVLVLCFCVGKQYYTLLKKTNDIWFRYTWKKWLFDILYLNGLIKCCGKHVCKSKKKPRKSNSKKTSKSSDQLRKSVTSGGMDRVPSVVVTAPKDTAYKPSSADLKPQRSKVGFGIENDLEGRAISNSSISTGASVAGNDHPNQQLNREAPYNAMLSDSSISTVGTVSNVNAKTF